MAAAAFPQGAGAQISDFSFFEEALAPHGDWLQVERYGPVWKPDVEEGWAPYTVGNWVYTDSGWTWISHEPFGNIVFHYGRWLLTDVGWCWVPGSDWGPAWVSWRVSGENIGWAPLPPEAVWHSKHGIGYWVDVHTEIGPAYYRFCGVRDFCSPAVSSVLFRPSRNLKIMLETHNVTNIVDNGRGVFCGGPQYRWVRETSAFEVPVLRLVREENVRNYYGLKVGGEYGAAMGFVFEDMLVLPGPRRVELGETYRNHRVQPVSVALSKGWYGDTSANERLRSHYDREWEARQSGQSRGMAAIGARSAEVQIQVVTNQERQAAYSEVANRGKAASPNVFVPGFAENQGRRPVQGRPQTSQAPSNPSAAPASGPVAGGAPGLIFDRRPSSPAPAGQGATPPAVQRVLPVSPQSPTAAPAQTGAQSSPRTAPAPVSAASRPSGFPSGAGLPSVPIGAPGGVPNPGVAGGSPSGNLPSPSSQAFTRPLSPSQVPSPAPGTSQPPIAQQPTVAQQPPTGSVGAAPGVPQTFPIRKRTNPLPQTQAVPTVSGAQPPAVTGFPAQTTGLTPQPVTTFTPQPQSGLTQPGVIGGVSVPSAQRRPVSQPQVQAPVQPASSSGASFSVIPAPAPTPRTQVQPSVVPQSVSQPQPFTRGAQPSAVPSGFAGGQALRPSAPAAGPAAAPASSGAALSTVPASPSQGQVPVKKKKPGDPGYVPPPQ